MTPDPYGFVNDNRAKPLEEMYVIVSDVGEAGGEGIMAFMTVQGAWMPMVGGDAARIGSMVKIARKICPTRFKVLRFTSRQDVTANYAEARKN